MCIYNRSHFVEMSESGSVKFIAIQSTRLNTTLMIYVCKSEVWVYRNVYELIINLKSHNVYELITNLPDFFPIMDAS